MTVLKLIGLYHCWHNVGTVRVRPIVG